MKTHDLGRLSLLAITLTFVAGCGGGGLFHHIGYHDIPDNVITVDELPDRVRPKVEAHVSGRPIKQVFKGVRRAHGSVWIYTVTFEGNDDALSEVQYTAYGEQIYAGPARQRLSS